MGKHTRTKYVPAGDIKVGADSFRARHPEWNFSCKYCHCSFIPNFRIPWDEKKTWYRRAKYVPKTADALPVIDTHSCPDCTKKELVEIDERMRELRQELTNMMFHNSFAFWLWEADFHDDEPELKERYEQMQEEEDRNCKEEKEEIKAELLRLEKRRSLILGCE
jgi:hypothetical protein